MGMLGLIFLLPGRVGSGSATASDHDAAADEAPKRSRRKYMGGIPPGYRTIV